MSWSKMVFSDPWLAVLAALDLPLTSLALCQCRGFPGLELSTLRTLTDLHLVDCPDVTQAGMVAVSSLPLLESLCLIDCAGASPNWLSELSSAPSLRQLKLNFNLLSGASQVFSSPLSLKRSAFKVGNDVLFIVPQFSLVLYLDANLMIFQLALNTSVILRNPLQVMGKPGFT